MARKAFMSKNFRADSLERIRLCNEIIATYRRQNLRLTLRQLYYQLVSRNVIPNQEKSYKALSTLVSDARLAGLMDWEAIEDRVRQPKRPGEFEGLPGIIAAATASYRLPRWNGQENYVELWVEKDALAGVLWPIAVQYHVTLMVNRGYSSQSAMYESANRFIERRPRRGISPKTGLEMNNFVGTRDLYVLYLGDHDPSGEDMVRDIGERLTMFGAPVTVEKLALTMEQIEEYQPPPNPAKLTDPRSDRYIQEHGDESWEVDALPPNVLTQIITDRLEQLVDRSMMDDIIAIETTDKERLESLLEEI